MHLDNPVQFRSAEQEYLRQLRKVAARIHSLIQTFPNPEHSHDLQLLLRRYSETLEPWAKTTAQKMLTAVAKKDLAAWRRLTKEMSKALKTEIESAPTGQVMQALLNEQVVLIKSLPLEAAQHVHQLVIESQGSVRPEDLANEILKTGEVTRSRAELIAITESGRAATSLTQARALHIGSEGYLWQTVKDRAVRESHRAMQGKFVRWDEPPTLDGLTGHAGALPRCRCFPNVVIPE